MSPFAATFLFNLLGFISSVIGVLQVVVIVSVVVSWLIAFDIVNVRNRTVHQIVSALESVSARLLYPIRRFVPAIAGLDFSPLIFLFLCGMVQRLLIAPLQIQIVSLGG